MIRITLTFLGVIICNFLFAQQFKPITISCGGGLISNTNTIITYTIGEPVSGNISNGSTKFTQGFQQNWTNLSTGIFEDLSESFVYVFPNPVLDLINLKFIKGISGKIELIDLNGKIVLNKQIEPKNIDNQINLSNYPEGIYIIKLSTQSGKLIGTYKIQKIK